MIKILIVGMPFSIHMYRWINNFQSNNFDIHIYSSMAYESTLFNKFENITFHYNKYFINLPNENVQYSPIDVLGFIKFNSIKCNRLFEKVVRFLGFESNLLNGLQKVLRKVDPDIVHTMESQHAGYLLSEVLSLNIVKKFKWVHSVWGIDFHYFLTQDGHKYLLSKMLKQVDELIVEGARDKDLALKLGYRGNTNIMQCTGGYHEESILKYSKDNQNRNLILLKGYSKYPRMGLQGLSAIEDCYKEINELGFQVYVYSCDDEMKYEVQKVKYRTDLKISCVNDMTHEAFLKLNSKAVCSITVNDTDGMPNTMLDAMLCGAFLIQSDTSCASDIITDGLNGYLINPHDSTQIKTAILSVIKSKRMRIKARSINREIIKKKYNWNDYRRKIHNLYA